MADAQKARVAEAKKAAEEEFKQEKARASLRIKETEKQLSDEFNKLRLTEEGKVNELKGKQKVRGGCDG
jgi:hypothetical protein